MSNLRVDNIRTYSPIVPLSLKSDIKITGSLETTGDVYINGAITASSLQADTAGVPLIESSNNIELKAASQSNVVYIENTGLQLGSYTNEQTQSIFSVGTTYFNTSTNKFMRFNGTSHIVLG